MGEFKGTLSDLEETVKRFTYLIETAIRKTCPFIDPSDMDDIEQEVKIKLWREISKSEKVIHNLGSYVWRIAYTTTSRMMKDLSQQKKLLVPGDKDPDAFQDQGRGGGIIRPDDDFEKRELAEIIGKAVNTLIDSRRQVVKMYLVGMSADEITDFFGWADGKARNLLSRGLADLREILREKGIEYK